MNFDLPPWLRAAIEAIASDESGRALARARQATSGLYRAGEGSKSAIRTGADAGAYLAARLPATYAAIAAALHQTLLRCPAFEPRSLLDVGAGPGTASFAASEALPGLASYRMIDTNTQMLVAARHLVAAAPSLVLQQAVIEAADMNRAHGGRKADLVIAGYATIELVSATIPAVVARLWQACDGLLLLVEPGTPAGYRNILVARAALIAAGGHVVAPCPGDGTCPLSGPDWCHFSQRLARSRLHRAVKRADAPFEDERYSYLAVAREKIMQQGLQPAPARILAPPVSNKPGIAFKLCTEAGLLTRIVPSRDKPAFKAARKLDWGDGF